MIIFNQAVRHERHQFLPGVSVSIPGAEHYFVAVGWASETNEPSVFTYDDVGYDALARLGDTGKLVLPNEAATASEDSE